MESKKDLLSKRVSLDIMLQEVVPQNIFAEVTKDSVESARQVAKKRSISTALEYLETTRYK